jgi:hypothetical protein
MQAASEGYNAVFSFHWHHGAIGLSGFITTPMEKYRSPFQHSPADMRRS